MFLLPMRLAVGFSIPCAVLHQYRVGVYPAQIKLAKLHIFVIHIWSLRACTSFVLYLHVSVKVVCEGIWVCVCVVFFYMNSCGHEMSWVITNTPHEHRLYMYVKCLDLMKCSNMKHNTSRHMHTKTLSTCTWNFNMSVFSQSTCCIQAFKGF